MQKYHARPQSDSKGYYSGAFVTAVKTDDVTVAESVFESVGIVDDDYCDCGCGQRWYGSNADVFESQEEVIDYAQSKWMNSYSLNRMKLDNAHLLLIIDGSSKKNIWFFGGSLHDYPPRTAE